MPRARAADFDGRPLTCVLDDDGRRGARADRAPVLATRPRSEAKVPPRPAADARARPVAVAVQVALAAGPRRGLFVGRRLTKCLCFYRSRHQPRLVALDDGLDVVVALDDVLGLVEVAHLLEAALVAHVLDDARRDRRVPAPAEVKLGYVSRTPHPYMPGQSMYAGAWDVLMLVLRSLLDGLVLKPGGPAAVARSRGMRGRRRGSASRRAASSASGRPRRPRGRGPHRLPLRGASRLGRLCLCERVAPPSPQGYAVEVPVMQNVTKNGFGR